MKSSLCIAVAGLLVATCFAQVVLGGGKGKVRATNVLSQLSANELGLQGSRRDFQGARNGESSGFWPAYPIQAGQSLFWACLANHDLQQAGAGLKDKVRSK